MKEYAYPISVVMPVYNMEEYMSMAIESILSQTFTNFEFIIIDDCSTDRSEDIIHSYLSDTRIKVLRLAKQGGNYAGRNLAISQAKGKYICAMDADDIAHPDRLELQFHYMESHPEVLAAGTAYTLIGIPRKPNTPLRYEEVKEALLFDNCFLHPSTIFRADKLKQVGGYNEEFFYAADYDLMCRLSLLGPVVNLPHVLISYRIHSKQISTAHRNEQKKYAYKIRRSYQQNMINRLLESSQIEPVTQADISHSEMGRVIYHLVKAKVFKQVHYEDKADMILSAIYRKTNTDTPLDLENGLCGIGCGLIYLLRNKLEKGDEDEVLSEIDEALSLAVANLQTHDTGWTHGIAGWIYYLQLRIAGHSSEMALHTNQQSLIRLIERRLK